MKFLGTLGDKLITFWVQIRDLYLYFFRHAIIVNGYVDDHTWRGIRHRNWGDDINYYFIQLMTGRPVVMYHNFKLAKWFHLKNYLCIGTLLDATNYSNSQTEVWGTGVSGQDRDLVPPEKIHSVRGKLTRDFLIKRGIQCPEVYGDIALLLPHYYQPKDRTKKYKLGIIPHLTDLDSPVLAEIQQKYAEDVLVISLSKYNKWTDVIDKICSCEQIASSSLHGLIVSDAYGIPNCWVEFNGKVQAGYFKYWDYGSSVNREMIEPFKVISTVSVEDMIDRCNKWHKTKINIEVIMDICPFC